MNFVLNPLHHRTCKNAASEGKEKICQEEIAGVCLRVVQYNATW